MRSSRACISVKPRIRTPNEMERKRNSGLARLRVCVGVWGVSENGIRGLIQPPYPEVVPLCPCVGGYVRSVLGEQFGDLTGYQRL